MTPFDFLNEITYGKKDLMVDDIEHQVEKQYNPFIVNRGLSYFYDTVIYANDMNIRHHLDKKLQNTYLLHIIRKKKRYSKWYKSEKSELLEIVMEYYGYSIKKSKEIFPLLTSENIENMKQVLDKGGMKGLK
jgi:hypothetical protein